MNVEPVDFAALMRAALTGDQAAYTDLLRATATFVRPWLGRYLRAPTDIEDVLQETLISIHKARLSYDGNRPYRPWALAIARYRMNDFLRKRYGDILRQAVDLEFAEHVPQDDVTKSGFTYEILSGMLRHLPEKQAQILELVHKDGLTLKETAQRVGMKESAVKVAAHRAYKILRKKLMDQAS